MKRIYHSLDASAGSLFSSEISDREPEFTVLDYLATKCYIVT
jgi:hypothetical protein